jgi:hypothetical protein
MSGIVVILLTYARTEYAVRTIRAAIRHLRGPELRWYVADDGSPKDHVDAVIAALAGQPSAGFHSEKLGYGGSANKAWFMAHELADYTFWLEDDWELTQDLDLTPYADMLQRREDLGMVRMGYLNLNMRGEVFGEFGKLFWKLDRTADPYVFTGHPSLRHRRFREAYGSYPEGLKPGETELGYAVQYRNVKGPEIVWPAAFGEYGPFAHIGTIKSYE